MDKKIVICVKKVFFSQNCATYSYTKLFYYFEAFLQELRKKLSFRTKKCFSHQIEPNIATLCFSVVLKHFYRNWKKPVIYDKKSVFLNKLIHYAAILWFSVVLKHFYRNCKNLSFRTKKCFSHQIEPYTATLSFYTV